MPNFFLITQKEIDDISDVEMDECYMEFFNDFFTAGRFAEYYEISLTKARRIIKHGRKLNHEKRLRKRLALDF